MTQKKTEKCTRKERRYLNTRKKGVKRLKNLIYERSKLNAEIRSIRSELNGWDRSLID